MRPFLRKPLLAFALGSVLCAPFGCARTIGPLALHASAFASATNLVTSGAADAYTEANRLHDRSQISLAILNFDRDPSWDPTQYLKPLLSEDQLQARRTVLVGLKTYADTIADIAAGPKPAALNAAAADVGNQLQALSKTTATSLATSFPNAPTLSDTERNAASTALAALGTFLQQRKVLKQLPPVLLANDTYVSDLCTYMESDIKVLRRQADRDYGSVIGAQDQYIRHTSTLSPAEHRAEIAKIPELLLAQQHNDELLRKLSEAVKALRLTHNAFAHEAQGDNPETLRAKIADLSAQGQNLASFYQSLATQPSK